MAKFDSLLKVYEAHRSYLGKKSLPPQKRDFENFAATFFCPGPFYYYVIDSPTLTLDYVSPSVEELFGIKPDEFSFQKFMDLVHPDELDYFLKCEDRVADFLMNKIEPQNVVNYKITYCLRQKTLHQGYRLFLLQTVTLQTTSEGSLLKVFGLQTDITHITKQNSKRLSFVGLQGQPSHLEIDVFSDDESSGRQPEFKFTKRELEVIRLLGEGLTTSEIAARLFVSDETIISHRKNTLAKTGFKNTSQVLAYCIRRGLV